ncbi:hypothetical protein [Treponema sp.]|uniref:hypothetical protein n=1 Tax=Treponema sp. TaxID=166 RepID=UPI00388E32BE
MKHTSLLLAATLFLANANLFANDAYTKVSGGSLLPVSKAKNENIKMEKEEINFALHKDYYDVSVKSPKR